MTLVDFCNSFMVFVQLDGDLNATDKPLHGDLENEHLQVSHIFVFKSIKLKYNESQRNLQNS